MLWQMAVTTRIDGMIHCPTGRRRRRAGICLVLLLALLLPLAAVADNFVPVGSTNGLRARIVPAMLLDRDGFLWIGSREGLFRYDGYEPLAFLPEAGNPDSISDSDIRCLYEDSAGGLWVGTYSGGLNFYDAAAGTFEHFRHDSADPGSISDDSILAIAEGPEGELWFATRNGLNRLDRASKRFEHFGHDAAAPASLSGSRSSSLHLGPSGHLWVGTIGGGVNRWNPQSRSFSGFDLAALTGGPAELNDIFALHEDRDGKLWLGTRVGLVLLDPAANVARELPLPGQHEFLPAVTAMAADDKGRLWLGTLVHGVRIFDMRSARWDSEYAGHASPGGHLMDRPQLSLALSQDMLFVGTWGDGVHRSSSHPTHFRLLSKSNSDSLPDENIIAVMATSQTGRLWLGTNAGGPQRATISAGLVEYPPQLSKELRNALVLGFAQDSQGRLWAGTNVGLFGFYESGLQTHHLAHDPMNPGGIGEGSVRSLLPAGGEGLWFGMDGNGLYYLEYRTGHLTNYRHQAAVPGSISGDSVTALLDGRDGFLWVGTQSKGLNHCRVENWHCQRFTRTSSPNVDLGHFRVTSLFRGRDGEVWVGTGGGGLGRVLQNAAGEVTGFRRWTREQGLLSDSILAIAQDLDESLWLSTHSGLSRLHPDTGRIVNYVTESGLPSDSFNANAAAADDRYIYFGTARGLLRFAKGSAFARRQPAQVRIAAIERTPPGGRSRPAQWAGDELNLPYGEVLSIKLATLDFSESAHDYAYRLHADDPWTPTGHQRQLLLHGLAPGSYEFQARGRDVFGSWGESRTLKLEIVPPWWMTDWFRTLLVILLLLAALAAHLARQAALERRAREIQRLAEKREQALELRLGSEAELAVLTPRQKEVLQLIAEGLSMKEIAERLGVSVKTVEAHRANLMDRLEIHDIPGLVRLAIRARLVAP